MPKYRVTFPDGTAGPAAYTAHAASKEHAEEACSGEYRYTTRGGEPGVPKTTPVYGTIPQED